MINIITPPNILKDSKNNKRVFLAGSIEMGNADQWQNEIIEELEALKYMDITVYNPRRADWDSTWEQLAESPQFFQQVIWELTALEHSDIIFLYFDPSTKSPISLLELGLHARGKKLIVCCPEGFWRKGNVDIVCNLYNIPLFDHKDKAVAYLKTLLTE